MEKIKTNNLRNYHEIICSNIDHFIKMDFKSKQAKNFFKYMIHNMTLNYFDSLDSIQFDCIDQKNLKENAKLKNEIKEVLHELLKNISGNFNNKDIENNALLIKNNIELFDTKFKQNIQLNNSNIELLKQHNLKLWTENFNFHLRELWFDHINDKKHSLHSHNKVKKKLVECVEAFDIYKDDFITTLKKEKKYFIDAEMKENFNRLQKYTEELEDTKTFLIKKINSYSINFADPDELNLLVASFYNYTDRIFYTAIQDKIENTIENFEQKTLFEYLLNKKSPLITNNRNKPKI